MSEFYEGLAEILEVDADQITPELSLEEGSWDSLAVVSTIVIVFLPMPASAVYDVTVHPNALGDCKTVGDIEKLVAAERGE